MRNCVIWINDSFLWVQHDFNTILKIRKKMKKITKFLGVLVFSFVCLQSNAQLIVDQSIVQTGPYKVGDTLTVKYTVSKGTTLPRYFWLRYQYNNKALSFINNSTTFTQGNSVQTYFTSWNNYIFNANANYDVKNLYKQYGATPWSYQSNADWNVAQLTVQRTDAAVDGIIATQKYVILSKSDYTNIHKLDMAYGVDNSGVNITDVSTTQSTLSLGTVTGGIAAYSVRITYPSTDTSIVNLKAQLQPLNTDGTTNWSVAPIATANFNAQGIATFTTPKVGDKFGVYIFPTTGKSYLNNIITVSDAYKAFLQVSSVGLNGTTNYFQYPTLEKAIGHVTIADTVFDNNDAYYLFANVMGIDVTSKTRVPSSTTSQIGFLSGKLTSWYTGILTDHTITITSASQIDDFAYAYSGDLDYSNSTNPALVANSVTGLSVGSTDRIATFGNTQPPSSQNATLSLASTINGQGKVILTGTLTKDNLAGLQVILQYDNTLLTLDNVTFDAGPSITNFSTNNENRITFGSLDQTKTARIKTGTPYTLIFTPKTKLTNTTGLFYTVLADAVDGNGNKVNLTVE
jgi:hypothetical protein